MLPPISLLVPDGTSTIYITAISLCQRSSNAYIFWTIDEAQFSANFPGPNPQFVLGDDLFVLLVITIESNLPTQLRLLFNFNDTMTRQHSVTSPVISTVGPDGNATKVQISGYPYGDDSKTMPTTVTI